MIDRVPWDEHFRMMARRWEPGQHITGAGHNGCGKTTLMVQLLPLRRFVCVVGTKPTTPGRLDPVLAGLKRDGYDVRATLPQVGPAHRSRRVLLWPRYRSLADRPAQRDLIRDALADAFTDGGWCLAADEIAYLVRQLGLGPHLVQLLTQGRSQDVSHVGFTQRPSHIPLEYYTEPTYLYAWRTRNPNDLRRLSDLSGAVDTRTVLRVLSALPKHDVLWTQLHTGEMHVTRPPALA